MFKRDSLLSGMVIGIFGPALLLGIIYLIKLIVGHFPMDKAMFVCVALNIVPIRYYFITEGKSKTGSGILAMTVVLIVAVTVLHL